MTSTRTHKHRELAAERLDRLRAILRETTVVRVDDLCEALEVSPATVRRDLEELERRGEARRVHGGAVALKKKRYEEPVFDDKTSIAQDQKERIARKAVDLIGPRETIYLDGGSTVLALARLLRERTGLTVVTNSLRAASELAGSGPQLILIGGELRRLSQTMVGPLTRFMLEELHIDKAFMGTIGISLDNGLTTTDAGEAYTKELVMKRAREVILLADGDKVGVVTFAHAGKLEEVGTLVTDTPLPTEYEEFCTTHGVDVVVA
jgi:DeoR family transcriptional regulator, fructose operon transcriptional repressor